MVRHLIFLPQPKIRRNSKARPVQRTASYKTPFPIHTRVHSGVAAKTDLPVVAASRRGLASDVSFASEGVCRTTAAELSVDLAMSRHVSASSFERRCLRTLSHSSHMTLSGALRPPLSGSYAQRRSWALLSRVFEAFRLRAYYSLLRLVSPLLHSRRRAVRQRLLISSQLMRSERISAAKAMRRSVDGHPTDTEPTTTARPRQLLGANNVVPYQDASFMEDLSAPPLLEQLCIPLETFHFAAIQKLITENGDVVISAEIPSLYLQGSSGMCLDEAGRQLSQLGLLAVCACNRQRGDTFYVATGAAMEEFDTSTSTRTFTLTGLARVVQLQAHGAQVEMELWGQTSLICRLSVSYDILSSWQEVLPNLAATQ